jgi:hypothetical protein
VFLKRQHRRGALLKLILKTTACMSCRKQHAWERLGAPVGMVRIGICECVETLLAQVSASDFASRNPGYTHPCTLYQSTLYVAELYLLTRRLFQRCHAFVHALQPVHGAEPL